MKASNGQGITAVLVACCLILVSTQTYLMGQHARFIEPPRIIKRVNPIYTDEARASRIEGTVALECVIRKDGTPHVKKIVRGLGYGLDESASTAIEQWRFRPQIEDGQAVDVTLVIEVNFPPVRGSN